MSAHQESTEPSTSETKRIYIVRHGERLDEAPVLVEQIGREFAIVRILLKSERQRYR